MSKSLSLTNGDLSASGRTYDLVRGKAKLMQDLTVHLIEHLGTDPATPDYGSTLDGPNFIGQPYTEALAQDARAEVTQILERYQRAQLEKIRAENIIFGGQNTLDPDEVIEEVVEVEAAAVGTTLLIRVVIRTLGQSHIKLTVPFVNA